MTIHLPPSISANHAHHALTVTIHDGGLDNEYEVSPTEARRSASVLRETGEWMFVDTLGNRIVAELDEQWRRITARQLDAEASADDRWWLLYGAKLVTA